MRLSATATDLPSAVAAALATPAAGERGEVDAGGTRWPTLSWGDGAGSPVLLVHGVTSNAGVWWRVGPALAAAGHHVIAVDMPGHGRTPKGRRSHRLADTAAELGAFIRAAGLPEPDLAVVGHSWGGMVTANLPRVGVRPGTLILLDPPFLTVDELRALSDDPTERDYATLEESMAAVRAAYPAWSDGDVAAKAVALTEFDPQLVLDVLVKNGDMDGGMAALRSADTDGVDTWLIRGEWDSGGLIPDGKVDEIEQQLGADHVITIDRAPHSPQRTHPEATVLAILLAMGR